MWTADMFFFFYFMFYHFLPALPIIPAHDPREQHVIWHHMTDSLGHLPAAHDDTCLLAIELLYHHFMLTYRPYGYVSMPGKPHVMCLS